MNNMKFVQKLLVFLLLLLISNSAIAQKPNKLRIAILDLNAGVNRSQSQIDGLADMLSVELFNSGCFTLIERTQVDKVILEQNFQKNSLSASQRKKIGEILGVDAIVTGIVNFIVRDTRWGSDNSSKFDVGEYNIDIRLINVENGELLSTAGGEQKNETERELMKRIAKQLADNLEIPNNYNPSQSSPYLLYDYLYVFPEDLGVFSSAPSSLITATNKNSAYGYNDWRLPTQEELDALNSNRKKLRMNSNSFYAHDKSWTYGKSEYAVRLVRTEILLQQESITQGNPYFEPQTCDLGKISVLSGYARGQFMLKNPTKNSISIISVSNTSKAIIVDVNYNAINPGEVGVINVYYNPNGKQGLSFKHTINVTLSDGQQYSLQIMGSVE